jgi:hypothetical protein
VPVLLRIENVIPGDTYDVRITYDCVSGGSQAFDFLAGIASDDTKPLMTAPGPERVTPDSALLVPDDASIDIDYGPGSVFRAWGATFSAVGGPIPQTPCTDRKAIDLSIIAQTDTVILAWAGHLASSADWGAANGAGDSTPFSVSVEIDGAIELELTLLPGSVSQ